MYEGNSSQADMFLISSQDRLGMYFNSEASWQWSHQLYLLACCCLHLGTHMIQLSLYQQLCNWWCDVGTVFELFVNHSLATQFIFISFNWNCTIVYSLDSVGDEIQGFLPLRQPWMSCLCQLKLRSDGFMLQYEKYTPNCNVLVSVQMCTCTCTQS